MLRCLGLALATIWACERLRGDKNSKEIPEAKPATAKAALVIAESPTLNFDIVRAAASKNLSVTIRNDSAQTAEGLLATVLGEGFSFAGGSWPGSEGTCGSSLAPDKECRIVLRFEAEGSEFTDVVASGKMTLSWSSKGESAVSSAQLALMARVKGSCLATRNVLSWHGGSAEPWTSGLAVAQSFRLGTASRLSAIVIPLGKKPGTTAKNFAVHLSADCAKGDSGPRPCDAPLWSQSVALSKIGDWESGTLPLVEFKIPRLLELAPETLYWWSLVPEEMSPAGAFYLEGVVDAVSDPFPEGSAAEKRAVDATSSEWFVLHPDQGAAGYADRGFLLEECFPE